jgi:uncharacterized glyoxalase superfamily protein PhnB
MWATGFCEAAAAGITVSEQDSKRDACMTELQTKAAAKCKAICPHFVVPDVVASTEHYRDFLGFKILSYFLDPPVFAVVARDDVVIHFGKSDNGARPSPNVTRRSIGLDAYIWVNDLDTLYAELQGLGAKIIEPPTMRVYKCYELVVEDNFGFRLCFSLDTSSAPS